MRSTFSYLSLWQSVSIDSELPKAWRPGFGIFSLPESSCLLFSAVFDRDNSPFFEGFRLDIESSKNAQGGLPGWDRNPELPAALCKRKNNFKQSGKAASSLSEDFEETRPEAWPGRRKNSVCFGTQRSSRRKAGIKKQGGSGKGPDEKGPYRRPRHYRSKSFKKASGRYRLQKLPSTVKNEFVIPSIRDGKG